MTTLLLVWYLLTSIPDTPACALWLPTTPTSAQFTAACRGYQIDALRLDVFDLDGTRVCGNLPGVDIYHIPTTCKLDQPLDHYILRLYIPAHEETICSVSVTHTATPSPDEITHQCGPEAVAAIASGTSRLVPAGTREIPPPAPKCASPLLPYGPGFYDQAAGAASLYTNTIYQMLAQRLIWYGIVRPDCNGLSGLDGYTLAPTLCGLAHSRHKVIEWQNQWDADIYSAAIAYNVPARMLKRMMGLESQFWPLYIGTAGEMSVMQITENGADVLLRYDPTLDTTYLGRDEKINYWRRLAVRNSFHCFNCDLKEAIAHTTKMIPMYARLLAAYRCRAVSITPALGGVPAWQQAAIDYNGSADYLTKLENGQ